MCVLVSSCYHVCPCHGSSRKNRTQTPITWRKRQLNCSPDCGTEATVGTGGNCGREATSCVSWCPHVCPGVLMCVLVSSCYHVCPCHGSSRKNRTQTPTTWGKRQLNCSPDCVTEATAGTGGNCGPEATVRTGVDRVGTGGEPGGTGGDRRRPVGTGGNCGTEATSCVSWCPHVCPGVLMCVLVSSCYHVCPCHGSSRKNRTQTPTTWGKRQLNCSPDCVTEGTAGTGVDRRELRHGGDIMCVLVSSCYHVCPGVLMCVLVSSCSHVIMCVLVTGVAARTGPKRRQLGEKGNSIAHRTASRRERRHGGDIMCVLVSSCYHVCPGVLMCVLVSSCSHVIMCVLVTGVAARTGPKRRQLGEKGNLIAHRTATRRRHHVCPGVLMCVLVSSCYHVCSCHGSSRKNRTQTPTTWGKRQLNCSPDCHTEATSCVSWCPHVCPGVLMFSCYHVCPCHGSSRKNRTQTATTWGKRQLNCSPDRCTEATAGTGVDCGEALSTGSDVKVIELLLFIWTF
ncbi:uncharacterized protein LOC117748943 isoform X1 [Cyclopterus lumpus]|uniref:uncharacterized protein LOC117748943 isoform X1 n=1 Tax=Cyclopterus lumpus TaxID=8103 RepID=UPI001485CDD2|nr:uncharacterized protein LOC117748943 isoform X1 [Cyclopterus lumpus]